MKKPSSQVLWLIISLILILIALSGYTPIDKQSELKLEVMHSPEKKCTGIQITRETPNTIIPALITSNHRLYTQECFKPILSEILKKTSKPFVLFISGRGTHPSKEVENQNQLLLKLEEQYGVTVVMFTWPSWCGLRCFPRAKAYESATALLKLLHVIEYLKEKDIKNRTYTLLSHSMGSIVLQGLVDLHIDDLPESLFDKIIISSSASPQNTHRKWLNKLTLGAQLFITSNKNDFILKCLESDTGGFGLAEVFCDKFQLSPTLGRWGADKATIQNISENAFYIDFTNTLGGAHRYYINQMNESLDVFRFYGQVFQGHPIELINYDEIISNHVYKLRK